MFEDRRDTGELIDEFKAEQRKGHGLRVLILSAVAVLGLIWAVVAGSHCVSEREKQWAPHVNPQQKGP